MANLYNKCIKSRPFRAEDLVLRKIFENTVDLAVDKFQPKLGGDIRDRKRRASRVVALNKLDGAPVPRMWNVIHLKRY